MITFLCSVISLFFIYKIFFKPPKPKPKEHKQSDKDKIVIEILSGKITLKAAAKREMVKTSDIYGWIQEFFDNSGHFISHKNDMNTKIGELEMDIKWFTQTCEKFIGADWKEKTEYDKRKR